MTDDATPGGADATNKMRTPRLAKVVVNIGVGEAGDKLIKAEKVLGMVTGRKPSRTVSRTTNRDFAIREGMPIGCRVTLRGPDAEKFVRTTLEVREKKIPAYAFDDGGNLNLGVTDYTEYPGQKYDPEIGIFGMDIAIVLERAGNRVKRRRLLQRRVGRAHRLTRGEAMSFMRETFGIEVF